MDFRSLVRNELVQDGSSVWVLKDHGEFGYSEGAAAERYLEKVLANTADLSSTSVELESHIKDWSSEYHLTTKRAQLLAGLELPRSARVLEVGCGCGAITRYLGETFDNVLSIEGSLSRARLARLRTRDLASVNIVCAPFQQLTFAEPFDVIFCIGVYEYSGSFVDADDPYDAVLRYFKQLLSPYGIVVIAIENQFGLKYFASSREDHVARMFEGIEGYHSKLDDVRTFGRAELEDNVRRHFTAVRFLYPYPDYKIPDCVLTEDFAASPTAGELISQMRPRDYGADTVPLWDEASATLELARNRMLPFFANSFLVLAGSNEKSLDVFPQLGVLFSASRRVAQFRTTTKLVQRDGSIVAVKKARSSSPATGGPLRLVDTESAWTGAPSLHTLLSMALKARGADLAQALTPCRAWIELLRRSAVVRDGEYYVAGEHLDSTWQNAHMTPAGCVLIDREWIWAEEIRFNVLFVRAAFLFLLGNDAGAGAAILRRRSGRALIRSFARALDVELAERDFADFVALESQFQSLAFGLERRRLETVLRWFLLDRPSLRLFTAAQRELVRIVRRAGSAATRLLPRKI